MNRTIMYRIIPSQPVNLLPQRPKIQRLVVDGRHRDAWVALLLVEAIKLFEEIDLGTRCFHGSGMLVARINVAASELQSVSLVAAVHTPTWRRMHRMTIGLSSSS